MLVRVVNGDDETMFIEIENYIRRFSKPGKILLPVAVASLITISNGANASAVGQAFDDMMSGSNVSVVLLNHGKMTEKYFKDKDKNIDGMDRQHEWGQALGLYYRTGRAQLGNTPVKMNVNVGYSYMFNLSTDYPGGTHNWNAGEKIFISDDCYWSGGEPGKGQYKCNDSSSYGKLPIANIKFDWGKQRNERGFIRVGDGFYNTGMITAASDDDALLSSYRGIMGQQAWGEYIFDGAFVTGFMKGNDDTMRDLHGSANYYDPDPLTYDNLYTMRVRKKFADKGGYQVAYGEAKDYLRRSHASAYYNLKLAAQTNLFMQTQYYYNRKAGDLWDIDVDKGLASYDEYASALSYEFRLRQGGLEFLYGFTKINAPRENGSGNGSFSYGFGDAKGYLKLPTSGNYHGFRRDGEEAMVVGTKYDFRSFGMPRLYIDYRYHWGKAPINSKTTGEIEYGKESEHAITMSYEPREGMMQGFVFNLKQAFYRPDETLAQIQPGEISEKGDKTATKFIVSYMFNI